MMQEEEWRDGTRDVYREPEDRALIRTEDVYQTEIESGTIGYSDTLLSVIANYRNSGIPEGANAQAMVGKAKRGEVALRLFARINPETRRIEEARFRTRGCLAVTACASVICTMISGKTFEEALAITTEDIKEALDGVPWDKSYTPAFAVEGVRALIGDFLVQEGASLEELDAVVPCDQSSLNCLICENCSLRSTRIQLMLEKRENEAKQEDENQAEEDYELAEHNALAAVFNHVRTQSKNGLLSFPSEWEQAELIPSSMTCEDLEMSVYDYLQNPPAPQAQEDVMEEPSGNRDEVFGTLNVPEGYKLIELGGEVVLVETDEEVPIRRQPIDCSNIKLLMGAHSYYLYDSEIMTDNFAHWAFLAAEDNDAVTFVDCVREESRVYPRPMSAESFQNRPFSWSEERVEAAWQTVSSSNTYPDICRVEASNGDVYFYSTNYLSEARAQRRAEWDAVDRYYSV